MKFSTSTPSKIIEQIKKANINVLVLYGDDASIASDIIEGILLYCKNELKYETNRVNVNDIDSDFSPLSEVMTESMFYSGKLVVFCNSNVAVVDSIIEEIKQDKIPKSNLILVSINQTSIKPSVKSVLEASKTSMLVSCFSDSASQTKDFIIEKLKKSEISFSDDVIDYFISIVGSDRGVVLSELEKIIVYKIKEKNITINDISLCLGVEDGGEGIFDICDLALVMRRDDVKRAFFALRYNLLISPSAIIPIIVKNLIKLDQVLISVQNGNSVEAEIKNNFFFKRVSTIRFQLKYWNRSKIAKFLKSLKHVEQLSRKMPECGDVEIFKLFVTNSRPS